MTSGPASYTLPGLRITDHTMAVPLDWGRPDGERIALFAREICDPARAGEDLPLLLYLQGGPGGSSPRPADRSGWLGVALERFRVVLLDQRGTGRSSPLDGVIVQRRGAPVAQADFLALHRADSVVADAEALRHRIYGGRRWSLLGQSYGGFITLSYLSRAPDALASCYIAGGLSAVTPDASEVYRRTFPRVIAKNKAFYQRFPQDVDQVARIADLLAAGEIRLPDGDLLTVRRFQSLGLDLGVGAGAARLHWLVDDAFIEPQRLGEHFLQEVQLRTGQRSAPLYWTLQEAIYGSVGGGPTGWAAAGELGNHPELAPDSRPLMFSGEMAYPWMFEDISALRPLAAAVAELARRDSWGPLYDPEALAANEVPVAAVVYHDDMFVDAGLQLQTLARLGNSHPWVTNEWEHDGLKDPAVLRGLLRRLDERA